jgi:hypothetical protein
MLRSFLFAFLICCLVSCGADKSFLEKYYTDNPALHSELRDSLIAFSKQCDTKVYLKQNTAVSDDIYLNIFFDDIPGYTSIEYDSALHRHDDDSSRTAGFIVPKGLVENFKSSAYHFISCENSQVFFGYKQDDHEIFAREVAFIGILTPFTGEVGKESKRISPDAIITNRYSP